MQRLAQRQPRTWFHKHTHACYTHRCMITRDVINVNLNHPSLTSCLNHHDNQIQWKILYVSGVWSKQSERMFSDMKRHHHHNHVPGAWLQLNECHHHAAHHLMFSFLSSSFSCSWSPNTFGHDCHQYVSLCVTSFSWFISCRAIIWIWRSNHWAHSCVSPQTSFSSQYTQDCEAVTGEQGRAKLKREGRMTPSFCFYPWHFNNFFSLLLQHREEIAALKHVLCLFYYVRLSGQGVQEEREGPGTGKKGLAALVCAFGGSSIN
jgi:hypothetical protein